MSVSLPSPAHLRDIAVRIAEGAAELVRAQRAELTHDGSLRAAETKSSSVDPVTVVDQASEAFIVQSLIDERPADGIMGEEGADRPSESGLQWIVDPIDGTVNFLYGIPVYAISIGVARDGEPIAGAVLNVATGELFQAAEGEGATVTCDGVTTQLTASRETNMSQSLVATGFAYTSGRREAQANVLTHLLPQVRDIRRMGAAALDACRVAEGVVEAYYEHGIHPWDYAAGAIIAREAGAVVTHPGLEVSGSEGNPVVMTAPGIADEFRALLAACGGDEKLAQ